MRLADEDGDAAFTGPDYASFGILLSIPALIGIYFAFKYRKDESTERYFFGGRRMNPIAVGISTAVTSISAVTMIAYPAEVYIVGTSFYWAISGLVLAVIFTYVYYVPFYSNLQLDTIYSYLRLRFNSTAQRIVAAMVMISEIFFMASIIYLPSIALNAVSLISINWCIGIIGGICTMYTTLGGMSAVVWSDVVQSILMLFAAATVFISGTLSVGGINEVTAAVKRGERDTFTKFEGYDVSSRNHPITLMFGEFFFFHQYLGFTQTIYQRILSCKNTRQSKNAIIAYFFSAACIICLSIANGLMMYAYFEGCDPMKSHRIRRRDQALPYLASLEFSKVPGLSGAFVAAVFSGSLSTISSGLNGYAIVIVNDFCPIFFPNMRQKFKVFIGKMSALILGLCVTITAYGISKAEGNLFKLMRTLLGSFNGSILGIYLLGIFTPWANSMGAIFGAVTGYIVMFWIFYGSNFLLNRSPRVQLPPVSIENCPVNDTFHANATLAPTEIWNLSTLNATLTEENGYTVAEMIYSVNFHYYVFIGSFMTVTMGLLVSFLTGHQRAKDADPHLFLPLISNPRFPAKVVKFFRLGVPTQSKASRRDSDQCSLKENEMKPLNDTPSP